MRERLLVPKLHLPNISLLPQLQCTLLYLAMKWYELNSMLLYFLDKTIVKLPQQQLHALTFSQFKSNIPYPQHVTAHSMCSRYRQTPLVHATNSHVFIPLCRLPFTKIMPLHYLNVISLLLHTPHN